MGNRLDVRIEQLKSGLKQFTEKVAITSCAPRTLIFDKSDIIKFSDVKLSNGIGNVENFKSSGTFTCEKPGLYLVGVKIMSHINYVQAEIRKNGHLLSSVNPVLKNKGDNNKFHIGTDIMVVQLNTNDTLYITSYFVQPSNGNKAYKNREWIGDVRKPKQKNLIIVNPIVEVREANGSLYEEEKLQELLRMFFKKYAGHPTLYIIDDCSATKRTNKEKKDMLSELAFSGRHAEQSVWVISQRYNSVLKDLREQTKWLCMFYTKDRDSFDNCLRENDVIPTLEERQRIKEELKKKHRKLILKTDQPTDYWLLN
ncbi:unnamed protein product [Mytilus coruscus]|uniref:C1q domain-containing protein n=1 Tax=Mytilus coruscus TaxID=42192 RepID=A0A6J8BQU8_MYTCO|nr:unnamed protein product [Mytilus coruscus]